MANQISSPLKTRLTNNVSKERYLYVKYSTETLMEEEEYL
jgi:hypothetical protein